MIKFINNRSLFFKNGIIVIIYSLFAELGLLIALPGTVASIVWFPAGIAVGSILVWGYKVIPGIFLGALFSNFSFFISDMPTLMALQLSVLIAIGNSLEAIVAKMMITKFTEFRSSNKTLKDNLLIIFSVVVASALAATVGSFANKYLVANTHSFFMVIMTWSLGDAAGIITVILPMLMYYEFEGIEKKSNKWNVENRIYYLLFLTFLASNIILSKSIFAEFALFFYLIIFFIMWAILRLSLANAVVSIFLYLATSIYMTINGYGPFFSHNVQLSLFALQGFAITLMVFSVIIRNLLSNQIRQQKIIQANQDKIYEISKSIRDTQESVILSMIKILEVHDEYTRGHSENVARLSKEFAMFLGMNEKEVYNVYLSGLIHDIGKLLIPKIILNKAGKLTDEEFEIVKAHPVYSNEFLSTSTEIKEISKYVYHHHERWDGEGYPKKLKENEIPLISQMIALADTYDAMTSERPYKQAMSHEEALEEIKRVSNYQFNPELADKFIKMLK